MERKRTGAGRAESPGAVRTGWMAALVLVLAAPVVLPAVASRPSGPIAGTGATAAPSPTPSAQPAGRQGSGRVIRTYSAPAPVRLDCTNWRYGPADEPAPGSLPPEFDRTNYKRTSLRDPAFAQSPQQLCGQEGSAVDLAWGVTQGDPSVRIAVLDSGIEWGNVAAMQDLADQAYINLGEAKPPCWPAVADGDCNHDGRFNIEDFGPIPDLNHNGIADPEDLILNPKYANGRDDDHDGYVDDISGWDFLNGDNDPFDTYSYGHGTGEAEDSTAAANGTGNVGTCPKCTFIPVRVGDSFIADGGRFAAGVLFALDSHASVIQEALGAIDNPPQAQKAIDIAYHEGVPIVASMADEEAEHPNLPSSLDHTMAVNSIRSNGAAGYLSLSGCTNYGGPTFVSVPSNSCSSEATGISSGIMGLLESEARATGRRLSTEEAYQVVRSTADDVDFSDPTSVDPANNVALGGGSVRFPTTAGWDGTTGYGRINAYEIVKAVRDGRIPPEADLRSPDWYALLPGAGSIPVRGRVAAPRASSYDYRVEWAVGMAPPAYPAPDTWHVVAERTGLRHARSGRLGVIDLAQVAAAIPGGAAGTPSDPTTGRADQDRYSVRVRIAVTAHGGITDGLEGMSQKQVFVHDDPDLVKGMPQAVAGAGTASPEFANLDGRGGDELIVATDDGTIHAFRPDGRELPGWPVHSVVAPYWESSPTARTHRTGPPHAAFIGTPVVADLTGNGSLDVAAADLEGNVYAWDARGRPLPGFGVTRVDGVMRGRVHTNPAYSLDSLAAQDQFNRTRPGIFGSLVAADLDGDGKPELIAAAMDRHVYAWNGDGTPVAGFPVLLVDPTKVQSVDPVTDKVTFVASSGVDDGGDITATPAVADLDGDGHPDIVVGTQEEYDGPMNAAEFTGLPGTTGNARVYAISGRGRDAGFPVTNPAVPDSAAYLPGWPFAAGMFETAVLPEVGDGVGAQAAIGTFVPGKPIPQIAVSSVVGPMYVLGPDGRSVFGQVDGRDVPLKWYGGLFANDPAGFGANRSSNDVGVVLSVFGGPSVGELDPGEGASVAAPTAGLTKLLDLEEPDRQPPADNQLMAWDPATGLARAGFPHETADMAFFVTPAIADVDGEGRNEVVAGNSTFTLAAVRSDGSVPAGWPKLTGGWTVGTPAFGDWFGDGRAEVAVVRRDGVLLVWRTPTKASALTQWPTFGANLAHTGEVAGSGGG